jgi:serine/threonine protein kinase
MQVAPGTILAGKYRLEHPLATGGMGSIWVGRHLQLDVPVAMKFMDGGHASTAGGHARFEREARWAAALRNQHVVQVIDFGVEDGIPYLVMELLVGEDLGERLSRERRISLAAASKILNQTARGLRTAHEARVVHRDLKPANIFLARIDDEEVVKILDFGIAKESQLVPANESTRTGELMGSPHYMSPEQVRSARDLDARSDLWSLSVILFRALTGRLPFPGDAIGAVIAQILADPIPRVVHVAPDLPYQLDAFFARGFARDRAQRFQTAREMAEAFALIANIPVEEFSGTWDGVSTEPLLTNEGVPRAPMPSMSYGVGAGGGGEPNTPQPATYTGNNTRVMSPHIPESLRDAWREPSRDQLRSHPSLSTPNPPSITPAPSISREPPSTAPRERPATDGSPTFGGGGTGSPVAHTRRPVDRTPPAWWGAATGIGTVLGVLCGAGLFVLTQPPRPLDGDAAPVTAATLQASAVPTTEPPSSATPTAEPAAVSPTPTAEPAPTASAAATSAPSASASASATAAPAVKPPPAPTPRRTPKPSPSGTPSSTPKKKP